MRIIPATVMYRSAAELAALHTNSAMAPGLGHVWNKTKEYVVAVSWGQLMQWTPGLVLCVSDVVSYTHEVLRAGDGAGQDGSSGAIKGRRRGHRASVPNTRMSPQPDLQNNALPVFEVLHALFFDLRQVLSERDRIISEVSKYAHYGWEITPNGRIMGRASHNPRHRMIQERLNSDLRTLLHQADRIARRWPYASPESTPGTTTSSASSARLKEWL